MDSGSKQPRPRPKKELGMCECGRERLHAHYKVEEIRIKPGVKTFVLRLVPGKINTGYGSGFFHLANEILFIDTGKGTWDLWFTLGHEIIMDIMPDVGVG